MGYLLNNPSSRLAWNILRSNLIRLPYPYKLTFAVTYRCNSRCSTCNIWKRPPEKELSLHEISYFFKNSSKISWVDLTGGEPFLREDFIDICEIVIQNCPGLYLLHFPTNGLLTDKIVTGVERILSHNPKQLIVSVSINGPPSLHDKLHGGQGNFDRSVETLRQLKQIQAKNFRVFPGMTVSQKNCSQIDDTIDEIKKRVTNFNPDELHLNLAHKSEHYYGNADMDIGSLDEVLRTVNSFRKTKPYKMAGVQILENLYLRYVSKYIETGQTPVPCAAMSASCFIDPRGNVYSCSIDSNVIGNLKTFDYDIKKMWRSEEACKAYARIKNGNCSHCWTPCEAYQTLLANLCKIFRKDSWKT